MRFGRRLPQGANSMPHRINPRKLLLSKWTALNPTNKERHFLVVKMNYDEDEVVTECVIEAVISGRQITMHWHELKDDTVWAQGWR